MPQNSLPLTALQSAMLHRDLLAMIEALQDFYPDKVHRGPQSDFEHGVKVGHQEVIESLTQALSVALENPTGVPVPESSPEDNEFTF